MEKEKDYRPAHLEFDVATDGSLMPQTFGEFENAEEASKFMGGNMVIINHAKTVSRHMDYVEKKLLREQYEDVLENILPVVEKKAVIARNELADAKENDKRAGETVSATLTEIKGLAYEVKRGLKEMKLDEQFTYQVAYKNRYYYYTYIDGMIRLVAIEDIPEYEKQNLFNSCAANEKFIDINFGTNEQGATSKGKKK